MFSFCEDVIASGPGLRPTLSPHHTAAVMNGNVVTEHDLRGSIPVNRLSRIFLKTYFDQKLFSEGKRLRVRSELKHTYQWFRFRSCSGNWDRRKSPESNVGISVSVNLSFIKCVRFRRRSAFLEQV